MKRLLSSLALLAMVLGVVAFQCSSKEITSAKLYIQQENMNKAKEVLEEEVAKNPQSDEGYFLLGYVNGQQGNVDAMVENFDKSLAISNKFEEKIHQEKVALWAESFNKGVGYFNKATKAGTEDSTKMYYDQAIQQFTYAVELEPDSLNTYQNLVFTLVQVDREEDAIPYLETLIEKSNSPDSYVSLGELYSNKGKELMASDSTAAMEQYNKAIAVLEKGRKAHPDNADILLLLSNAYIAADKMDVAMDAFKAGVAKEPENQYYRYNYGVLLLGAELYEEAAEQFEQAVKIDPEYTNALYNLGVTYVKWGSDMRVKMEEAEQTGTEYKEKFELALVPLSKYLELKPEEPAVWELVGKVQANLGNQEESLKAFEKADEYRN